MILAFNFLTTHSFISYVNKILPFLNSNTKDLHIKLTLLKIFIQTDKKSIVIYSLFINNYI